MTKFAVFLALALFIHSVNKKNMTHIVADGFIVIIVMLVMIYQRLG